LSVKTPQTRTAAVKIKKVTLDNSKVILEYPSEISGSLVLSTKILQDQNNQDRDLSEVDHQ
jgi:hypothetical protein